MLRYLYLLLIFIFSLNCRTLNSQEKFSKLQFVDPMIGTAGHGHTYPGATVPFGLVQLSPDTDDTGWDWCSGYNYQDSSIMGFSHTHLSGTGISDLADVLIMPCTGKIQWLPGEKNSDTEGWRSRFSHKNEVARPGYYAVKLQKYGIYAELTASHDEGLHRYTFPPTDSAHIMIDLLHGLDRHRTWLTEHVLEASIQVIDSVTVAGHRISSGWANIQPVYFQIRFSRPFKHGGLALNEVYRPDIQLMRGRNVKGVFTFDTNEMEQVELTVRISDIPFQDTIRSIADFDEVRLQTAGKWQQELTKIDIQAPDSIKRVFYTALYHTALSPNKLKNDGNSGSDKISALQDEYGTLSQWDVYRAAFALNTIFRSDVTEGILGTMLRSFKKNGYLPVWKLWHDDVHCMIGTPSVPILVEAVAKGYGRNVLHEIKEAIIHSMSRDNPVAPWKLFDRYGYIPTQTGELFAVSKTLEMAYASSCAGDFLLKYFPEERGLIDLYSNRATFYKNVFDRETGFFRGKKADGSWDNPFDPSVTQEEMFVEATPWQYLFHVHHDIPGMIDLFGGEAAFIARLDSLFSAKKGKIDAHILDITGLIGQYAHGNEPSHHVAYLYNDVGMAWKTQEKIIEICSKMYSDKPDGLCGNEDCGQMSAWYIFSALGFYPVHPASGTYYLGIPLVESAQCYLHNGNTLKISKKISGIDLNNDKSLESEYRYIKEIRFNDVRLTKPFISHDQIMGGGTLEFMLSKMPDLNDLKK